MPALSDKKKNGATTAAPKANGKNGQASPAQPAKPKPKPAARPERVVMYERMELLICNQPPGFTKSAAVLAVEAEMKRLGVSLGDLQLRGALTYDKVRAILNWETESEYAARRAKELKLDVAKDAERLKFKDEEWDWAKCKNIANERVMCWNNANNRELDLHHADKLGQEHLEGRWVCNCENVILGRTGLTESAQHRLIGFMRAVELYRLNPAKYPFWKSEPYLMTTLATGADESAATIATLDNVKARTEADTISTSPIFANLPPAGRKECSRCLAAAIDFLWARTDAGVRGADAEGKPARFYQTHSESAALLDRHSRLKECVKHVYDENQERAISILKLSAGQCSAAMYLMACSATKTSKYHVDDPDARPSEKQIDFEHFDKAEEFWTLFAGENPDVQALREAISNLPNEEGEGGRTSEKMALICLGWGAFLDKGKIAKGDLQLEYAPDKQGRLRLVTWPRFGSAGCGIDLGDLKHRDGAGDGDDPDEVERTQEEIKAESRKKAAREAQEIVEQQRKETGGRSIDDRLIELRKLHSGVTLVFKHWSGTTPENDLWRAYGNDAVEIAKSGGGKVRTETGRHFVEFKGDLLDKIVGKSLRRKIRIALVEDAGTSDVVTERKATAGASAE